MQPHCSHSEWVAEWQSLAELTSLSSFELPRGVSALLHELTKAFTHGKIRHIKYGSLCVENV